MKFIGKVLKVYFKVNTLVLAIMGSGLYINKAMNDETDKSCFDIMDECLSEGFKGWAKWFKVGRCLLWELVTYYI